MQKMLEICTPGRKTLNKHTPWWTKDTFPCINRECSEAPEQQRAYQLFDRIVLLFEEKKKKIEEEDSSSAAENGRR